MNDKIIQKYTLKQKIGRLLLCPFKPKSRPPVKHFLINFLIATLVIAGLYWLEDSLFFKERKDDVLDWVMYWHSDFVPTVNNQEMQRMMLFEIDEKTFRAWGSSVITPRDKLKALIEQARKGGANVIAVDLELSWRSDGCLQESGKSSACLPTKNPTADELAQYQQQLDWRDQELAEYLQNLNESEDAKTPLIILTRLYRHPIEGNQTNEETFLVRPPSFLDNTLKEQKNIFWASTFFEVDTDRVRRRWQLAALVCQDEHLMIVPSMQLFVALTQLYATPESTRQAAQIIRTKLKQWNEWANTLSCDIPHGTTLPKLCQHQTCPDLTVELPKKVGVNDKTHLVDLARGRETERVVYRFAPADNPNPFQRSLIDKKSALDVLVNGAANDNQIVFIGVTHQYNDDHHPVPIRYKEIDGVYVVANAVDTLLRFGQFRSQPFISQFSISLIVIIITTVLFTFYGIVRAFMFSTLFVGGVLFLGSGQALHHGIGVDIALPMLTIQILQVFRYFLEYAKLYLEDTAC